MVTRKHAQLDDGSLVVYTPEVDRTRIKQIITSEWGENWIGPTTLSQDCFVILGKANHQLTGTVARYDSTSGEFVCDLLRCSFKPDQIDAVMLLEQPKQTVTDLT